MPFVDAWRLIILLLAEWAQLMGRSFLRRALKFFWMLGIAGVFGVSSYDAVRQYDAWHGSSFSKFFLPPYQPGLYFFSYIGWRIFAPWLLSLAAAYLASRLAEYWNARKGERFFEPGETRLFALGIFLAGYPGFLFYFAALLAAAVSLSAVYSFLRKGRAPLFYIWLPAAIFAILLKNSLPGSFLNNFIL